ncbi:VanZ family protein [Natronosalvus vescus]|uniref:VanZ family protein n=1 Tax=Natronosalvus vescus TaxID=2953881 RepID=UPI00209085C0|nr:VanZ family protein [Natronosalvus vescus]
MTIPVPLFPRSLRLGGVFAVAAIIFYFSILAIPPETPSPDTLPLPTWNHVLAYVTLGLSLAYAITDRNLPRSRKMLLVFVIATGYGALIELGQGLVPARHMSGIDILINAVAVAISLGWYLIEPRVQFVSVSKRTLEQSLGS